tara:strand:+ start:246 stop:485 length:240 start_codon:yes stop_codon:yes gene_type:complete
LGHTLCEYPILFAFGAGIMAFDRGPVSLSSAIMSSRPILIVAYAVLVGQFFPRLVIEPVGWTGFRTKALAAGLVTLGVV